MNKYIIPVCDIDVGSVWNKVISAKSITDCKEKLMAELIEYYDFEEFSNYSEFVSWLDENQNILVGNITDIEEL